jgi:basic membrane protein A and related proteins
MKKLLCACLVLISVLSISCQKKSGAGSANNTSVTVRLLTDASGVDDKSFNAAAWRGILEFYGDTEKNQRQKGKAYDWVTTQDQSMYLPNLKMVTDEKYDLIIVNGYTWSDALETVSKENPNQKYLIVDVDWVKAGKVMQAVYAEHEGSYLVGVAAALKALEDGVPSPKFGFIGGMPSSTITKFEVGYVQGILSIIPNAQIVDYYVNDWDSPGLAKNQAMNWYNSGVYVIFSAAGNSGNGTIAQAKEYSIAGKKVWAIGVDSDQYEDGLYNKNDSAVLTSMVKRVENAVIYALNEVKNKNFKESIVVCDLKADGVGYSDKNPALSKNIVDRLELIKKQIISGNIVVEATLKDSLKLPGFPKNLRAVDD